MSTGINEVVFELYREFSRRNRPGSKFDRYMLKLERAMKHPVLALKKAGRHLAGKKFQTPATENVFTATDKKFPDVKIAVYTVITGGYDKIKSPVYVDDELDYYAFTDSVINANGGEV